MVALMQGAELATIHSSIQQASALVPDYGSLMAWRVVLAGAGLLDCPQLKGYQPALPLLSLAFVLVLAVNDWPRRVLRPAYDRWYGYRQLTYFCYIKPGLSARLFFFDHEIFRLSFCFNFH
jgi:hypothetical protein